MSPCSGTSGKWAIWLSGQKELLERWLREDYYWAFRDQLEWETTGQISRRYVANLQADGPCAIRSAYTAQENAPDKERSLDIEEHTQRDEEMQ